MNFFKKTKLNAGFTVIELMVVLSIFAVISAVVLFNYRDFSDNVALQNLTQDIALQAKRAQTQAINGFRPSLSGQQVADLSVWKPSYGVAFKITENPKSFIYYFNSTEHGVDDFFDYTDGSYSNGCGGSQDSECLEEIIMTGVERIEAICFDFIEQNIIDDTCPTNNETEEVYVSFTRPRSNAHIIVDTSSPDASAPNVYIKIGDGEGSRRYVIIWESGQISVR